MNHRHSWPTRRGELRKGGTATEPIQSILRCGSFEKPQTVSESAAVEGVGSRRKQGFRTRSQLGEIQKCEIYAQEHTAVE